MIALEADVLIVGAGPVGMTLAMDLASRGVSVLIVERNAADEPSIGRCNHISSRTMEIWRRLGFASEVRAAGLPEWYPPDIAFVTTLKGYELGRIKTPPRAEQGAAGYANSGWPTAEPLHRCNQTFFEPVLREHLLTAKNVKVLYGVEIDSIDQNDTETYASGTSVDGGERYSLSARYLVGCDGGSSLVRKCIGARFEGEDVISRTRVIVARVDDFLSKLDIRPAWTWWVHNPRTHGVGNVSAIDGVSQWRFGWTLPPDGEGFEDLATFDVDKALVNLVGRKFDYEVLSVSDWNGRRLVADKLRDRRIVICGDAAHIWAPFAGYGMNAGIASAFTLSWELAALVQGWGGPTLLEAYEAERLPITEQVSRDAMGLARRNLGASVIRNPPAELEHESSEGDAARAAAGAELLAINTGQFIAPGLNYGYHYDGSPAISHDGGEPPAYDLRTYRPSTVPGCRTPHVMLEEGISLYDRIGSGFGLIRSDPSANVAAFMASASARGIPLTLIDLTSDQSANLYDRKLVLSRPDHHVAWRGDAEPEDLAALLDLVTGHGSTSA